MEQKTRGSRERLSKFVNGLLPGLSRLDFYPVEARRYPALALAREALAAGGGMPAVLNAANEIAVAAFLEGKISFPEIVSTVSGAMSAMGQTAAPASLDEAEEIDRSARAATSALLRRRATAVAT